MPETSGEASRLSRAQEDKRAALSALAELKSHREARWEDVERLTVRVAALQTSLREAEERAREAEEQEAQSKAEISKLKAHNLLLERALISRNKELEEIDERNSELEDALKSKESLRLIQLQTLAVRNVELEKRILRAGAPSCKF